MDDAELVRATCNADASAFTAIFDRYAARVHDLALAMLRDRGAALEVVESTFLEASLRIQDLDQPHRLPIWLLAVTRRNAALRAGPVAGTDRQPSLPNDDPERVRLASLVWEAVADLPLRERTLIDLDLRHGLDGNDLADAMGVTLPQAQHLQARMRDRIEKGLSGYVIAKTAEGRCPDLTKVLKGWDGRFTPKDSGRIARHVEGCKVCNQIRFSLPSPFALYAAALPAPFPAAVRPRVLERVMLPVPAGGSALAPTPYRGSTETEAMPYQHPLAPSPSSFATAAPLPQAATASHDAAAVPWLDPFEPPPPPAPPSADSSFAAGASPGLSYPDPAAVQEPTSQLQPAPAPYPADPLTGPYQPPPPTPAPASYPADPPAEPYQPLPPMVAPGPPAAASAPAEPAPAPAPMPEYDPAPPFHYDPTPMPNHGQAGTDHEPAPMPDHDQAPIAEPAPMPERGQASHADHDPTPAAEHQAPAAQPDPTPVPDHGQFPVAEHHPMPVSEDEPTSPIGPSTETGPLASMASDASSSSSPGSDAMPEHAEPVPQPPHTAAPPSEHPAPPPPPSQESP